MRLAQARLMPAIRGWCGRVGGSSRRVQDGQSIPGVLDALRMMSASLR
ncbi:hypothetical protein SMICM17S_12562 [Streptomyces microflavus]